MIIDLAKIELTNDIFTAMLPSGSTIIINSVDENFLVSGEASPCIVKAINVQIQDTEGNRITCPNVIGLGNELMQIVTDHSEYEGVVLTPDNRDYCRIEVYE